MQNSGYVSDFNRAPAIDVQCLAEGKTTCTPPGITNAWDNHLLVLEDSSACLFKDKTLHCVDQERDGICLRGVGDIDLTTAIKPSATDVANIPRQNYNRHELCPKVAPSLYTVGAFVALKKSINLRSTPGGAQLAVIPKNGVFQTLDFELQADGTLVKRYYRIVSAGQEGYIYGGDNTDYQSWMSSTTTVPASQWIARPNNTVKITNSSGINLRATPGGDKVGTVALNSSHRVKAVTAQGGNNDIYYQLTQNSVTGWIYGGQSLPQKTFSAWATITATTLSARQGVVADHIFTSYLRTCADSSCDYTKGYLIGGAREVAVCQTSDCMEQRDTVEEIESGPYPWVRIRNLRDSSEGWVREPNLQWQN